MKNRVQLNDQELENVVGGVFNFYTKGSESLCYVEGSGTFLCSPDASAWIVQQMTSGASTEDVVAKAIESGMLHR